MILYIVKFSACLAVFMLFYKLFLERESFHKFKRFYLLGTLIASAIIPLITFTTYIEATPIQIPLAASKMATQLYVPEHLLEEPVNYWLTILWSIYGMGVLVFTIRFGMNLTNIVKRIKQNPKFKNQLFFHVLLTDLVPPHTFLNYIFFNKEKYEAREIPQEVLLHEEAHAREKHALDILFIEVLQIIFWFNPLLYLIKKDIKLNHEFLADQAVINNGIELKNYQNTLLAFSSHANEPRLANAINYSFIKKRFTVMKTQTSKHVIWVRSFILLPLLAILIYSFSSTKEVEKTIGKKSPSNINEQLRDLDYSRLEIQALQKGASKEQIAEYNKLAKHYNSQKGYNYIIKLTDMKRIKYLYDLMTGEQRKSAEPMPNFPPPPPPTPAPESDMKIPPPPPVPTNATDEQKEEYKKWHEEYYKKYKVENGKVSEHVPPPPPPPVPADATPEQKEKHQKVSEEYYKKYKVKNGKVSKKSTSPIKTGFIDINGVKHYYTIVDGNTKYYNRDGYQVDKKGKKLSLKQTNGDNVLPNQKITKVYHNDQVVSEFKKNWESNSNIHELPPPPPPPMSPLDHVVHMAKKNATFYYEGKQITSDKAMEIMKSDKDMNILSKSSDSKNPKVYLSKEPITIKNN